MKKRYPSHLSKESKQIWGEVIKGWEVLESDFTILRIALESFDRLQEARKRINLDGLILTDDKGPKIFTPGLNYRERKSNGPFKGMEGLWT